MLINNNIYWSKIRIWNVEQHIMFYWSKVCIYSTCDAVISTVKKMSPPVQFVTHIIVQRIRMKKHCKNAQNMSYNIQAICVYLVDVRALICWAVNAVQFILECIAKFIYMWNTGTTHSDLPFRNTTIKKKKLGVRIFIYIISIWAETNDC